MYLDIALLQICATSAVFRDLDRDDEPVAILIFLLVSPTNVTGFCEKCKIGPRVFRSQPEESTLRAASGVSTAVLCVHRNVPLLCDDPRSPEPSECSKAVRASAPLVGHASLSCSNRLVLSRRREERPIHLRRSPNAFSALSSGDSWTSVLLKTASVAIVGLRFSCVSSSAGASGFRYHRMSRIVTRLRMDTKSALGGGR